MAQVAFERVSKIYPDGTRAVNDINLEIHDGEFMVLVGPSGLRQDDGAADGRRARGDLRGRAARSATGSSTTSRRATATSRWCSRATRSIRTCRSTRTSRSACACRKMPKAEIDERVQRAAQLLGLEDFLKRKPRALSGGQRQRVAMGRAIVREPAAFLMDEPLSNLDAKLRVQTRAEIAKLQSDLGVTTIYVTHDQIEAMTMGDRVAVMRKGELQQVDDPQTLYDRPVEPLRRRLHRQPGDEHARRDDRGRRTATSRADDRRRRRSRSAARPSRSAPGCRAYAGKPVIIGIRPEDLEDAALETGAPPDRIAARPARAARGARLGDHGPLRDQGRARRDGRDARARRGRRRVPREPQIGVERGRSGRGRPLRRALPRRSKATRWQPSSTPAHSLLRPRNRNRDLRPPERSKA